MSWYQRSFSQYRCHSIYFTLHTIIKIVFLNMNLKCYRKRTIIAVLLYALAICCVSTVLTHCTLISQLHVSSICQWLHLWIISLLKVWVQTPAVFVLTKHFVTVTSVGVYRRTIAALILFQCYCRQNKHYHISQFLILTKIMVLVTSLVVALKWPPEETAFSTKLCITSFLVTTKHNMLSFNMHMCTHHETWCDTTFC